MFRSGKYKWSLVAVAILLLLAVYRNQVTKSQNSLNDREPVIHENIGPQFAEIPQPVNADNVLGSEFGHMDQVAQRETIDEIQADEIERFALSDDGGDFKSSQSTSNVEMNVPAYSEPETVVADDELSEVNEAYASTESHGFSPIKTEDEFVPSNPVLQSMQGNEQQLNVGVESVPDFEPAFARSPSDGCLLYTSPSPRDRQKSRMPSSA